MGKSSKKQGPCQSTADCGQLNKAALESSKNPLILLVTELLARILTSQQNPQTSVIGPCSCTGQSSGGGFTCEDGVCVYIPKPNYYAVLVNDPNTALPYWERPENLGLNCPRPLASTTAAKKPKRRRPRARR